MAKEDKKAEKATSIEGLKKLINKEYGAGSIMQGRASIVPIETFPTYVAAIDRAFGIGGLPQGRIIELFGLESSGKTTTCLQFIAACQRYYFPNKERNGVAAFIDAEHAFDPTWAGKCGVDMEALLFSQPSSGEEAFDIADKLGQSGLIDLIVIDSVSALIPRVELEGELSDANIGVQARLMSKGLRKLKGVLNQSKTTVVFINQIRQKIGVMYGDPSTTSGGLALKFYATIRAQIVKGKPIKEKDVVIGFRPELRVIKNKCAPPFTTAEYDICVGLPERPVFGIDEVSSLIDVGKDVGAIEMSGSSYYVFGNQKVNGLEAATKLVKEHPEIQAMLREKIYGNFQDKVQVTAVEVEDGELEDDILDRIVDGD